ncbi:MAG: ubiquinol-cytochrome C chaperone family protein [Proteobacteria bacterium]|nr:ubiquinol-cytochrome C chaperone family protein [Pseudomonadota bacterium]
MALANLFRRATEPDAAHRLYLEVVKQARQPQFFAALGVPDTVQGRFEMIALHAFLVLHRLKRHHEISAGLAQELFDVMFDDMDRNLREMGTGDLGVGKRVKRLAEQFYGRIAAYEAGLAADEAGLCRALERNIYGAETPDAGSVRAMADYLRREAGALGAVPLAELLAGRVGFGPPPPPHPGSRRPGERP